MMYIKQDIEDLKKMLREELTEERYIHSLGTMETAVKLAKSLNLDTEKAEIAGLMHDCAKCTPKNDCAQYMYLLNDDEKQTFKTWHAAIGAYVAENKYGITDSDILSAIRWHTIGKKDMTDFEKVIFIADKIEHRTRDKDFREKIENVLEKTGSLDEAMLKTFKLTITSLLERNLPICYRTIDVYNDLLQKTLSKKD